MVVLFCQLFSELQHRVCNGGVVTAVSGEYVKSVVYLFVCLSSLCYLCSHLASGEGIVMLGVTLCVCLQH